MEAFTDGVLVRSRVRCRRGGDGLRPSKIRVPPTLIVYVRCRWEVEVVAKALSLKLFQKERFPTFITRRKNSARGN